MVLAFNIRIRSFADVQDFVSLATVQPFHVMVGNERQQINAKSFMGMFGLDYSHPLLVTVDCGPEEFQRFQQEASRFLA